MGMPSPYCEEDPPPIGMNYAVWMLAYGAASSQYGLDTKIFHIWKGRVRSFTLQTICLPHHWNLAQVQKTIAASAPLWIISLDLSKAFDKVDWNALWAALRQHRIPEHLIFYIYFFSPPPFSRVSLCPGLFYCQAPVPTVRLRFRLPVKMWAPNSICSSQVPRSNSWNPTPLR